MNIPQRTPQARRKSIGVTYCSNTHVCVPKTPPLHQRLKHALTFESRLVVQIYWDPRKWGWVWPSNPYAPTPNGFIPVNEKFQWTACFLMVHLRFYKTPFGSLLTMTNRQRRTLRKGYVVFTKSQGIHLNEAIITKEIEDGTK